MKTKSLDKRILDVLKEVQQPLKARDIKTFMEQDGCGLVQQDEIDRSLYYDSKLSGLVEQGSDHRWPIKASSDAQPSQARVAETSRKRPSGAESHVTSWSKDAAKGLPRIFWAGSPYANWDSTFIQCIAIPAKMLRAIHRRYRHELWINEISQWRMDWIGQKPPNTGLLWLSIAESIILRGRLTLLSPTVEELVNEQYGINQLQAKAIQQSFPVNLQPLIAPFEQFDSEEERVFFECLRQSYPRINIVPQASMDCLTSLEKTGRRVDFLVSYNNVWKVVEINGLQHEESVEIDQSREQQLNEHGIEVLGIEVDDLRRDVQAAAHYVADSLNYHDLPSSQWSELMRICKIVTQIHVVLVKALSYCTPEDDEVSLLLNLPEGVGEQVSGIIQAAIDDFNRLAQSLTSLYQESTPTVKLSWISEAQPDIVISFSGKPDRTGKVFTCVCGDVSTPFPLAFPFLTAVAGQARNSVMPDEQMAEWVLQWVFRKGSFIEGQWDAIYRSLQGKDSILLLPTGAGKSIAFQMSSLLRPGRGLVIDPILSLIDDQIDNLQRVGVDRVAGITSRNSTSEREELMRLFTNGEFLFMYVAPERLQIKGFRDSLRGLVQTFPISLSAIDEAHCVSEWGHDFRTAYLNLANNLREYCSFNGVPPPIMALTGTASRSVLRDVQRELGILSVESIITPQSFNRTELQFEVRECKSEEKFGLLLGMLNKIAVNLGFTSAASLFQNRGETSACGLIFCIHVGGGYGVDEICERLGTQFGGGIGMYSGSPPRKLQRNAELAQRWNQRVMANAGAFKDNELICLACTKAYGMGIDKPNIRYTIHYNLPPSPEAFYQEAGRAGRDRQQSYCVIIYSVDDEKRAAKLLSPQTTPEEILGEIDFEKTRWDEQDDVTRLLGLHSFRGMNSELRNIEIVMEQLRPISRRHYQLICWGKDGDQNDLEKAIHRLCVVGAIRGYTVDYAARCFEVEVAGVAYEEIASHLYKYIANFNRREAEHRIRVWKESMQDGMDIHVGVRQACKTLIEFIYEIIERSRRRSMFEMLDAARQAVQDGEVLRRRLLDYFDVGVYDEDLQHLIDCEDNNWIVAEEILDQAVSPSEASKLRAQVGRALADYPTNPWLLMVRAIAECYCFDTNEAQALSEFIAAIRNGYETYQIEPGETGGTVARIINLLVEKSVSLRQNLIYHAWNLTPSDKRRDFKDEFVKHASLEVISFLSNSVVVVALCELVPLVKLLEEINGNRN